MPPHQPAKHEEQFSSWPTSTEIRQLWLESASATFQLLEFEQLPASFVASVVRSVRWE